MPDFVCRRYRRSAPDQDSGTVIDELRFSAASAAEAENRIRRMLPSSPMGWKNHFATLEGEDGQVLVKWLHSWWHG